MKRLIILIIVILCICFIGSCYAETTNEDLAEHGENVIWCCIQLVQTADTKEEAVELLKAYYKAVKEANEEILGGSN